jgi:hypothetical protein
MAELLLKTNATDTYAEGDILAVFNRRRTRCVHAEHLCHIDKAGFNGDGLRPIAGLAWDFRTVVFQYLFRRVTEKTIERVDQWSGKVDVFGPESIDVAEFLKRATQHATHGIFGAGGAERWFGGQFDASNDKLDQVWDRVTHHTGRRESEPEFEFWPCGRLDVRHHLAVRVKDIDDAEADALVTPLVERDKDGKPVLYDQDGKVSEIGTPKVLARREQHIDWRTEFLPVLEVTAAQVLDKDFAVGEEFTKGDGSTGYSSKEHPPKQEIPVDTKEAAAVEVILG